ncbi:MAG: hypothetical protein KatS3mg057_2866 [Herpetosiphonaceae bacterium]|nr:MAG: hypothetical protein KatS3mg057_2866 [Herpetosiphonaceae bacterium]
MIRSQQEVAGLTCPSCGEAFQAPLWLIVDAGERPDLREAILAGTLHAATCPHCGAQGTITAPLLYHDPAEERLIAALPLTIGRPEDARAIVSDLRDRLLAAIPRAQRGAYLGTVELAAELDGLRLLLRPPEVVDTSSSKFQEALEELVAAESSEQFRDVLVRHRGLLMDSDCDAALEELIDGLRSAGDWEAARRVADQRALLARFRAALNERRRVLLDLLDRLAPLQDAEVAILGPLRQMLEAVDHQEVYAARLQLTPDQHIIADRLIERLRLFAQAEQIEEVDAYLAAIQR